MQTYINVANIGQKHSGKTSSTEEQLEGQFDQSLQESNQKESPI